MSEHLCRLLLVALNIVRLASQSDDLSLLKTGGSRLAVNDDLLVLADNEHLQITIIEYAQPRDSIVCTILYDNFKTVNNNFRLKSVHSVVLNSEPVDNTSYAVLLGIDVGSRPLLIVLHLVVGQCSKIPSVEWTSLDWWTKKTIISFAVDPPGEHICVILDNDTICLATSSFDALAHTNAAFWKNATLIDRYSLTLTKINVFS